LRAEDDVRGGVGFVDGEEIAGRSSVMLDAAKEPPLK
jgi:hypothetical protein